MKEKKNKKKNKNTLVCFHARFRDLKFLTWGLEIKLVENYFFLENYVKRAVSHKQFTINLFPLLVTKQVFMLIIILSNYQ